MTDVAEEIRKALVEGELPCAAAFTIAERLGIAPLRVGEQANALDVKLSKCQLGLFGYGPKAEGRHRRVEPMREVPGDLALAINSALGPDGRLSCAAAWKIAAQFGLSKQTLSNAAEGLGVRVKPCQLGAF